MDHGGAIDAWLQQAQQFGPLYGDGLSNHLPMGLIALHRLGASAADFQRFHAHESATLAVFTPARQARQPRLGQGGPPDFPAYLAYFTAQIASRGIEATVRSWLPPLMAGVAASAFHGLIRLAYALDAHNAMEAAHALASWCSEFADLDLPAERTEDAIDTIAATLAMRTRHLLPGEGIIIEKMRCLASAAVMQEAALQPASIDLCDIAAFSLTAFASNDNFTLLHLVTATHALRLALPYCADPQAALRSFWGAALVAFLTAEPGQSASIPVGEAMDWPDAFARARQSNDPHTIKLAYSAYCEHAFYGDDRYFGLVRRRLKLPWGPGVGP